MPWVCTTLHRYKSITSSAAIPMISATALYRYPIVGTIMLRQPADSPFTDTTVIVETLVNFLFNFLFVNSLSSFRCTQMGLQWTTPWTTDGASTIIPPAEISTIGPCDALALVAFSIQATYVPKCAQKKDANFDVSSRQLLTKINLKICAATFDGRPAELAI